VNSPADVALSFPQTKNRPLRNLLPPRWVDVSRKLGNVAKAEETALRVIEITSRKLEVTADDIIVMSRLAEAYARFDNRREASATLQRAKRRAGALQLRLWLCVARRKTRQSSCCGALSTAASAPSATGPKQTAHLRRCMTKRTSSKWLLNYSRNGEAKCLSM